MTAITEIRLVVPLEPPSGNHYKKFRVMTQRVYRDGRLVDAQIPNWYHTSEAKAWWAAVAIQIRGRQLTGKQFEVSYVVYQGKGSRGDVDNYSKCILDALVKANLIKNDDAITDLHCHKRRDRERPRTVIQIRPAQAQLF